MKVSKVIVIISILFFGVFSAWLFILLLFKTSIDPVITEYVFLINVAKVCFAIFLLLSILMVLIVSVKIKKISIEKIFLIYALILISGILIFTVNISASYKTEYEWYINSYDVNFKDDVAKYFPYKVQIQNINPKDAYYQISNYSANDVVYIDIYNDVFGIVDYSVEYFEFKDKILNYKFLVDREVPCSLNDYECEVCGDVTDGELEGIEYKLYIDESDYVVVISNEDYGYYAYLDNGDLINVSAESFVKTAIEQFIVVQNLAKTSEVF